MSNLHLGLLCWVVFRLCHASVFGRGRCWQVGGSLAAQDSNSRVGAARDENIAVHPSMSYLLSFACSHLALASLLAVPACDLDEGVVDFVVNRIME